MFSPEIGSNFQLFGFNRSGSIVVDYRVTWEDDEDLSDEVLANSLTKYLKENYGYLASYFIPTETLSYTKVIDTCAMKTNEMRFVCILLET